VSSEAGCSISLLQSPRTFSVIHPRAGHGQLVYQLTPSAAPLLCRRLHPSPRKEVKRMKTIVVKKVAPIRTTTPYVGS
jgi:hypothetical protein